MANGTEPALRPLAEQPSHAPATPVATAAAGVAGAVCLAGPTASGKTAVALELARQLAAQGQRLEIISVDSALVYQGMDIGTAKPSAAELAAVPHHLIDLIDPSQAYSAARFVADTLALLPQIRARGAWPLLVGGTMLYFKALQEGLHPLPGADAEVRAQIDREAAERGWNALHNELAQVDPATAARLASNDSQRIQRALEVWRVSGRTLSDWHQGQRPGRRQGDSGEHAAAPATDWPLVSMEPMSRVWLHQRIEERLRTMFGHGLVQEVVRLRQRGDLHPGLPAMRCVGYRQVWQALDEHGSNNAQTLDTSATAATLQTAIAATRQLAKRQLTWLRSMPQRLVVVCDEKSIDAPTEDPRLLPDKPLPAAVEHTTHLLHRMLLQHEAPNLLQT